MHLLLKKGTNYKGIIIITHKEATNIVLNYLIKKKKEYYILCHNGCVERPPYSKIIDLYLTTRFNMCYKNSIPFTSRNFLDKIFNNNEDNNIYDKFEKLLKKYKLNYNYESTNTRLFDFICVNRSSEIKKTYDLLIYITNYAKYFKDRKVCFIIIEDNLNNNYYKKILNYYENNRLENILFINAVNFEVNKSSAWKGLNREELSILYRLSKIYMHGCEDEGESRTIHEALCSGCRILAKENMRGGGLDYLNITNSLLYNKNNYSYKMVEIMKNVSSYKYDSNIMKILNEKYTIPIFLEILYKGFNYKDLIDMDNFKEKCNCNNMMDKLPAHDISEPWYIYEKSTADIKEISQINIVDNIL